MKQNQEYLRLVQEIQCVGKVEVFSLVYHHLEICGLQRNSMKNKKTILILKNCIEFIYYIY